MSDIEKNLTAKINSLEQKLEAANKKLTKMSAEVDEEHCQRLRDLMLSGLIKDVEKGAIDGIKTKFSLVLFVLSLVLGGGFWQLRGLENRVVQKINSKVDSRVDSRVRELSDTRYIEKQIDINLQKALLAADELKMVQAKLELMTGTLAGLNKDVVDKAMMIEHAAKKMSQEGFDLAEILTVLKKGKPIAASVAKKEKYWISIGTTDSPKNLSELVVARTTLGFVPEQKPTSAIVNADSSINIRSIPSSSGKKVSVVSGGMKLFLTGKREFQTPPTWEEGEYSVWCEIERWSK